MTQVVVRTWLAVGIAGVLLSYGGAAWAGADDVFDAPVVFPNVHAAGAVVASDFDRDGDVDLVISSGTPLFFLNNGEGQFTRSTVTSVEGYGNNATLAAGDVDGDDITEFVACDFSPGEVIVWDGGGTSAFSYHAICSVARLIEGRVALGDVDADGDLDLLFLNGYTIDLEGNYLGTYTLYVFLNDGAGTFGNPTGYTVPFHAEEILAEDLDCDGHTDIALAYDASMSTYSVILWNKGDGTLEAPERIATTGALTFERGALAAVVDLNGDGYKDFLTRGGVLINRHDRTFALGSVFTCTGQDVAAADVDGDGDMDAIQNQEMAVKVYLNDGQGALTLAPGSATYDLESFFVQGGPLAAADFDGDGDVDVAIVGHGGAYLGVLKNDGHGAFPRVPAYVDEGLVGGDGGSQDIGVSDLDGDGWMDVVTASSHLMMFRNDQAGGFCAPVANQTPLAGLTLADANDDGHDDILTIPLASGIANDVLIIQPNLGDGTFGPDIESAVADESVLLASGDFDGDGHLDLVLSQGYPSFCLALLMGDGTGAFSKRTDFLSLTRVNGAVGADFDQDGDMDLAVNALDVTYVSNEGNRVFTPLASFANGYGLTEIAALDLDRDGDIDLFMAGDLTYSTIPKFRIGLNRGGGNFEISAEQSLYTGLKSANDFVLDSTSLAPAATRSSGAAGASIFGGSHRIAAADFDGNGTTDLAVGRLGGLSVCLNPGNGTLPNWSTFNVLAAATGLAAVDVDNDGDIDLVASIYASPIAFCVLENKTMLPAPVITTNGGVAYHTNQPALTLEGTCSTEAVAIRVNGATTGVRYTSGEAMWTYTGALAEGANAFAVTAVSNRNLVSRPGSITITLDTSPSAAPVIMTNDGVDFSTATAGVTLEGTCTADTAELRVNGGTDGVTYAGGQMVWSYEGTLTEGANVFAVIAYDDLGNASAAATITVTYAPPRPDPPVILTHNGADFSTADPALVLTGTCGEATTQIQVNGATTGVIFTPLATSWTYVRTLANGANQFSVVAYNAEGRASDPAVIRVTLDTSGPAAPTITTNNGADFVTDESTVTLEGTCVRAAQQVFVNGSTVGTVHVVGRTTWSYTGALVEGANTLFVTVANSSGCFSPADTIVVTRISDLFDSPADVNDDRRVDASDVQLVINAALGIPTGCDCDINDDGRVDAIDVQLVINALLGIG